MMLHTTATPSNKRFSKKYQSSILAFSLFALAAPATVAAAAPQFYSQPGSQAPFSAAVRTGNMVYVSGTIGTEPDGTLPVDFRVQAANVMRNIAAALKLAGASMDEVFKCDVAMTDMSKWPEFNTIYGSYFKPRQLPARMAVGVTTLAKGAAVEMECQAYLHSRAVHR